MSPGLPQTSLCMHVQYIINRYMFKVKYWAKIYYMRVRKQKRPKGTARQRQAIPSLVTNICLASTQREWRIIYIYKQSDLATNYPLLLELYILREYATRKYYSLTMTASTTKTLAIYNNNGFSAVNNNIIYYNSHMCLRSFKFIYFHVTTLLINRILDVISYLL